VSSSGRDTALMKQAQSKRLSGSLSIFKVEWWKDPKLKGYCMYWRTLGMKI